MDWGPKTASNLKVFFGAPFDVIVSSPSLAASKSMAIEAPAAISSVFKGLHRQKTLMFPAIRSQYHKRTNYMEFSTPFNHHKRSYIILTFQLQNLVVKFFPFLGPFDEFVFNVVM